MIMAMLLWLGVLGAAFEHSLLWTIVLSAMATSTTVVAMLMEP